MRCNAMLPTERRWGWARTGGEVELSCWRRAGQDVRAARQQQVPPYVLGRYVELRGAD